MPLKPSDTRELFARECQFPTDRESVVETVGEAAIVAPNGGSTTVKRVLARSDETSYASVAEIHSVVMANLTDDHIGRKYYDDRSPTTSQETEVSF